MFGSSWSRHEWGRYLERDRSAASWRTRIVMRDVPTIVPRKFETMLRLASFHYVMQTPSTAKKSDVSSFERGILIQSGRVPYCIGAFFSLGTESSMESNDSPKSEIWMIHPDFNFQSLSFSYTLLCQSIFTTQPLLRYVSPAESVQTANSTWYYRPYYCYHYHTPAQAAGG